MKLTKRTNRLTKNVPISTLLLSGQSYINLADLESLNDVEDLVTFHLGTKLTMKRMPECSYLDIA